MFLLAEANVHAGSFFSNFRRLAMQLSLHDSDGEWRRRRRQWRWGDIDTQHRREVVRTRSASAAGKVAKQWPAIDAGGWARGDSVDAIGPDPERLISISLHAHKPPSVRS